MSARSNFDISGRELGSIVILSILFFTTLASCEEYRAETKRVEKYLGNSKYSVKSTMDNAKIIRSVSLEELDTPNDSLFEYKYVPKNVKLGKREYNPQEFIEYVEIVFKSKHGEISHVSKDYHMKDEESLRNRLTGTVLSMIEKYGITRCSYGMYSDKEPDLIDEKFIKDWRKLGRCERLIWKSYGSSMYDGEYEIRVEVEHQGEYEWDPDETENDYIYSVGARKYGLYE